MTGIAAILSSYAGRTLTVEYRPGRGWFVMEGPRTLMGFNNKRLLRKYAENVIKRGKLYTPTVSETYGR